MSKLKKLEEALSKLEVIKNHFPDVRVFFLVKEALTDSLADNKMQPMETAPRDRGILLRFEYADDEPYEKYSVAKYAEWSGKGFEQVWETGSGECVGINSTDLVGWYELPED